MNSTILRLADNVQSWKVGDKIVVASTDYSMYQAEEFVLLPCRACKPNEVKVAGRAEWITPLRRAKVLCLCGYLCG